MTEKRKWNRFNTIISSSVSWSSLVRNESHHFIFCIISFIHIMKRARRLFPRCCHSSALSSTDIKWSRPKKIEPQRLTKEEANYFHLQHQSAERWDKNKRKRNDRGAKEEKSVLKREGKRHLRSASESFLRETGKLSLTKQRSARCIFVETPSIRQVPCLTDWHTSSSITIRALTKNIEILIASLD